ncbi:YkgJ family cysteine cluster protein [Bacillus sp. V59.32b]|uniref:YkgJ family cysteine cluster protein n=1 Tax=Bacillus sp. V59.32b TaxID=1758642 RepID=UPI000E3B5AA0|nr:YkgJ family cysteine cluster protein [Bacillus sp. V59.32b]
MTRFPCTSCGACCSSIDGIGFLEEYNQNGRCTKLNNNECSIYESRPLLCRIDDSYDQIFSSYMTREEFYRQNAKACNELQEKLNIDIKYRVYI